MSAPTDHEEIRTLSSDEIESIGGAGIADIPGKIVETVEIFVNCFTWALESFFVPRCK
ncbi:MAG: hypothetical protein ACKVP3_01440 [Hyphomicrobiaceae bacterium]